MSIYEELTMLGRINSPEDLKALSNDELELLCGQIRNCLIATTSNNGGHLASNLGVVELTVALHLSFDCPKDKLIFDVGHQSYVHKLLTGRAERFDTLRRKNGIAGFPKRTESEYDAFNTGHSSTSVSAALGMLRAMRLRGDDSHVVAILGDGALTGGMVYEAMDDAGQSELPLIVVLNDNNMSISQSVGGMSAHLAKLRTNRGYKRFKRAFSGTLKRIPLFGRRLSDRIERFKNRIKYFLLPNVLFEELGFIYLGPLDGHDIRLMRSIFDDAKRMDKPVLIHVITRKGKGYKPAESNPEKFHGIGSFDPETGATGSALNNSRLFAGALCEIARQDDRVVAITAAMASGTGLDAFQSEFPDRFFDVGIAEAHGVTMAAGMAAAGIKPVFAVYSTFLQRGYDQILHDVCLQKLPVVFAIDRAGLVGADGETHQGVYDIAYLMTMPNFTLLSPSSRWELSEMLKYALTLDTPCALRYSRGLLMERAQDEAYSIDEWEVIAPARHVTVVATGRMLDNAIKACEGLDCGLINARVLKPIARRDIQKLNGAKLIITVEDGNSDTGFGAQLSRIFSREDRGISVMNLGVPGTPVETATIGEQDEECGLRAQDIHEKILECLRKADIGGQG